jgi:hypothetical protein
MNELYFPSLSEDGWIMSGEQQADYLFSHFFVSDYSQTQLYLGHVASLPWIIQVGNNDMATTVKLTRSTLETYFTRYFEGVEVEVTEKTYDSPSSKAELTIYVRFLDREGKEIVLGKLAEIIDLKVNKIIDINNG